MHIVCESFWLSSTIELKTLVELSVKRIGISNLPENNLIGDSSNSKLFYLHMIIAISIIYSKNQLFTFFPLKTPISYMRCKF